MNKLQTTCKALQLQFVEKVLLHIKLSHFKWNILCIIDLYIFLYLLPGMDGHQFRD